MKRLLAGALVMFGVVSSAHAQCSAYTSTMAIAEAVGENSLIIEYTLDNNADFIFYAVPGDAFGAWYVGESGAKELKDWDEDENGTVVFTDDDGDICTIGCDGDGGITVLIEDEYQAKFTPAYFAVDASGSVTNAPPPVRARAWGPGSATA